MFRLQVFALLLPEEGQVHLWLGPLYPSGHGHGRHSSLLPETAHLPPSPWAPFFTFSVSP